MSNWEQNEKHVLLSLERLEAKVDRACDMISSLSSIMAVSRNEAENRQWWSRTAIGGALTSIIGAGITVIITLFR